MHIQHHINTRCLDLFLFFLSYFISGVVYRWKYLTLHNLLYLRYYLILSLVNDLLGINHISFILTYSWQIRAKHGNKTAFHFMLHSFVYSMNFSLQENSARPEMSRNSRRFRPQCSTVITPLCPKPRLKALFLQNINRQSSVSISEDVSIITHITDQLTIHMNY